MVSQQAVRLGNAVLRQQQLQRRGPALGLGRTQQPGQLLAATRQRGLHVATPGLQFLQLLPGRRNLLLQFAQLARGPGHALIGGAQLACRVAAPAFDLAAFGGHLPELLAYPLQSLACVRRVFLGRRGHAGSRGEHQRRGQAAGEARAGAPHQPVLPSRSRLRPVISSGRGTPSRSRMVGATSRNEPPSRNVAGRVPW